MSADDARRDSPPPCGEGLGSGEASRATLRLLTPRPDPLPARGEGVAACFGDIRMNDQGRPTRAEPVAAKRKTFTGNRALADRGAAALRDRPQRNLRRRHRPCRRRRPTASASIARKAPIDLPALSEPEAMRHYVRLSQKNYAIDMGIYPLGSCTMKHNPRLNEQVARLPGFADIHPLQPASSRAGRAGADPRARPLAARDHRHACRRDDAEGRRAWRALRHDGDQGGARRARRERARRCWCRNRRTAPIRRPPRCSAIPWSSVPAREDGTVRADDVREAARRASRARSPRSC